MYLLCVGTVAYHHRHPTTTITTHHRTNSRLASIKTGWKLCWRENQKGKIDKKKALARRPTFSIENSKNPANAQHNHHSTITITPKELHVKVLPSSSEQENTVISWSGLGKRERAKAYIAFSLSSTTHYYFCLFYYFACYQNAVRQPHNQSFLYCSCFWMVVCSYYQKTRPGDKEKKKEQEDFFSRWNESKHTRLTSLCYSFSSLIITLLRRLFSEKAEKNEWKKRFSQMKPEQRKKNPGK